MRNSLRDPRHPQQPRKRCTGQQVYGSLERELKRACGGSLFSSSRVLRRPPVVSCTVARKSWLKLTAASGILSGVTFVAARRAASEILAT